MNVTFHLQKFDELRIFPTGKEREAVVVCGRQWVEEIISSLAEIPHQPTCIEIPDKLWNNYRKMWRKPWS
jgi:hypothetical protein